MRAAPNVAQDVVPLAQIHLELGGDGGLLSKEGTRAGLLVLAGMLGSFLFIRTSARLMRSPKVPWWPGSVETEGGLHVHHLVFGIILMLLAGFLLAVQIASPGLEIVAALFGIGAGLTLDEFALWLHLEDVYWSDEGRSSVDAVVIAALVAGLILMGFLPATSGESAPVILLSVAAALALSIIAVSKGKIVMGVAGILFPLIGLIGAVRLAKPDSPWGRRRYPPGSGKLARAQARAVRHTRRYRRFQDRIAGTPLG
jgi:uncharacterized membrane protein